MKQYFGYSFQVNGTSIPPGTYNTHDHYMPIDYYVETGAGTTYYSDQYTYQPYSVYSITLTSITETTIKGHFTGNFLAEDFNEDNTIAITEGEFVAKRIR